MVCRLNVKSTNVNIRVLNKAERLNKKAEETFGDKKWSSSKGRRMDFTEMRREEDNKRIIKGKKEKNNYQGGREKEKFEQTKTE